MVLKWELRICCAFIKENKSFGEEITDFLIQSNATDTITETAPDAPISE